MAIKWRNRLGMGFWAMMATLGLSGLLVVVSFGKSYIHRDYFHTLEFRSELDQFAHHLNMFELNHIPFEQAKQSITVSEDEINAYRNGLGNITTLITTLKSEYQSQIEEAMQANNQEAADIYIAERDKKIEDITRLFKSDDYARAKVMKEKEAELNDYYTEREQSRAYFLSVKNQFQYYFTSNLTDQVYTNLGMADDEWAQDKMNTENVLFRTSYSLPAKPSVNWNPVYSRLVETSIPFKGEIAVVRDLSSTSPIMVKYNRYKQEQMMLWGYSIASIVAFALWIIFAKKATAIPSAVESWTPHYNKLPIDVRMALVALTSMGTVVLLFYIRDQFIYVDEEPFVYGWHMLVGWTTASFCWSMTMIQGKIWLVRLKDWSSFKKEWKQGLWNRTRRRATSFYYRAKKRLSDAFLNKSTGTQAFILLMIVFFLGVAALMISLDPVFIIFYVTLVVVIGLPIVLLLIFKIGYFNRIVLKTNELAIGELGQDLPVSGKSVLSKLAENINGLKQGVKTLQNKQAKSERLKTELITNVSHDAVNLDHYVYRALKETRSVERG